MTRTVRSLLRSFDLLSEPEKRELAAEIMRRSLRFEFPSLSEEELLRAADGVFLELDRQEAHGASPPAR